jgi:hypothetical protein
MPAKLNTEHTESTEHAENTEKRFAARAEMELSRFSRCPFVVLCELCSENTAKSLRISAEITQYFHAHCVSYRIMTDCVEFRDREYSETLSKTAATECKHLTRKRSRRQPERLGHPQFATMGMESAKDRQSLENACWLAINPGCTSQVGFSCSKIYTQYIF